MKIIKDKKITSQSLTTLVGGKIFPLELSAAACKLVNCSFDDDRQTVKANFRVYLGEQDLQTRENSLKIHKKNKVDFESLRKTYDEKSGELTKEKNAAQKLKLQKEVTDLEAEFVKNTQERQDCEKIIHEVHFEKHTYTRTDSTIDMYDTIVNGFDTLIDSMI